MVKEGLQVLIIKEINERRSSAQEVIPVLFVSYIVLCTGNVPVHISSNWESYFNNGNTTTTTNSSANVL